MTWIKTQRGTLLNAAKIGTIAPYGATIEWYADATGDLRQARTSGQIYVAPNEDEKLAEKVYEAICAQLAIEEPLIDMPQIERDIRLGVQS
jgi:hypothetical protein